MRIALAGNPNSGKTTMYNSLTGSNEKVGNWAGVTVDKKEHRLKKSYCNSKDIIIVDLPGAYSMSPFTSEENVTSSYIKEQSPDVIINIVDSTNLSRSLFFTTQLLELSIPVIVALNKSDISEKKHTEINVEELSKRLKCPVVETISTSAKGLKDLIDLAIKLVGTHQESPVIKYDIDLSNKEMVEEEDRRRYEFVKEIINDVEKRVVFTKDRNKQDKFDKIITNKWIGLPIFAVVMFLVFWISQSGPGLWIAEGVDVFDIHIPGLVNLLEMFKDWIESILATANASRILISILVDGILGGFIAVIGFLPLVMVMYFLIALLEDCGYMARVSVLFDPIFKKVGLSGKSVIAFIVGTGCAIPGVMACRTIKDERERRATAMLAPFMPCGAKLPVIALFAGAFFKKASWVGPLMYFVGIIVIFLGALLINAITENKKKHSYFIIELPEYKLPSVLKALGSMLQRGWSYIVKAGTVILVCNFVIHMLQSFSWNFTFLDYNAIIEEAYLFLENNPLEGSSLEAYWESVNLKVGTLAEQSMLNSISGPFAYIIAPVIGVVAWQLAAAFITGFIAKENVVGTLAVCFAIPNLINTSNLEIIGETSRIAQAFGIGGVAALAYLMLNLFSPPCFAAIGAMNSEIKSKKWLFAGIGLQLSFGYALAFLVFFFGTLFTTRNFGSPWMLILGFSILLLITLIFTILILKNKKELMKVSVK